MAANFRNDRIQVRIAYSIFSIHVGPNLDITWNALDPVWHAKLFAPLETLAQFVVQLGLEQDVTIGIEQRTGNRSSK